MQGFYPLIGSVLVEQGLVSEQQLAEALEKQQTKWPHRKIGRILYRLKHISKDQITQALSKQYGIPIIRLHDRIIDPRVIKLLEPRVANLHRVIPLGFKAGTLYVATENPGDLHHLDDLSRWLNRPVKPLLASSDEISAALKRYYRMYNGRKGTLLSSANSPTSR